MQNIEENDVWKTCDVLHQVIDEMYWLSDAVSRMDEQGGLSFLLQRITLDLDECPIMRISKDRSEQANERSDLSGANSAV